MMTLSSPCQKFLFMSACTVSAYAVMFLLAPWPTLIILFPIFADVEDNLSVRVFCATALLGWGAGKWALLPHGPAACKRFSQLNAPGILIFTYQAWAQGTWDMPLFAGFLAAYVYFGFVREVDDDKTKST
jgi:hypothetical protein